MPTEAFWTNTAKKRRVIKFAENLQNDVALRDSI